MSNPLEGRRFDLLVIGGGITGAGVARDAAMRGLDVALVEKDDFASGTSSRSSRLVHGGLRYLEHAQVGMVRESVRERDTLLRIAPHLVRPLRFTWPVYRGARIGRWKLRAGLKIYDLLARAGEESRHRVLDPDGVLQNEPQLSGDNLRGGASYWDASTDDSRLTLANIMSAASYGAVVANHCAVIAVIAENGKVTGAVVDDVRSHAQLEVTARVVVNATGPWRERISAMESEAVSGTVKREARTIFRLGKPRSRSATKGVHVAVPRERVENRDAITITSPDDGRVMFILPADTCTIIGTTDTWTAESPDEVRPSVMDVSYLLRAANKYFPAATLTRDDVIAAWAGIRPLASTAPGSNPSSISREHAITRDAAGVIIVSGGKLTTYRAMAAEIVDTVERSLGNQPSAATTADAQLPGAERGGKVATLASGDPTLADVIEPGLPYTFADLIYAIRNEMALTLSDLFMRRTRIAFETRDHGAAATSRVIDLVGRTAEWSDFRKREEIEAYATDVARIFWAAK
jgi:glycerol-3-phosphate dehydrogenase